MVRIVSIGTAVPLLRFSQAELADLIRRYYEGKLARRSIAFMTKILAHPSISHRNFAVRDITNLPDEEPDVRIQRFTSHAVDLASEAMLKALNGVGVSPSQVSCLIVNTCTGYICPGLSTYLMERFGLRDNTRCYDLVGAGCGGSLPNLELCTSILRENPEHTIVSIAVEICSATFQMDDDRSLLISNAIFGDGAAAAVLVSGKNGLRVVATERSYAPQYREDVRYVYRNGQLHNQLSVDLPRKIGPMIAEMIERILIREHLNCRDITHWIVHPGGDKILNAVQDALNLKDEDLKDTREVLQSHGNMSSPSSWFVLEKSLKRFKHGDWCMVVAFGAGLSAHAALLKLENE
jgi:alkylresorcinol/alkylpyrone synthase